MEINVLPCPVLNMQCCLQNALMHTDVSDVSSVRGALTLASAVPICIHYTEQLLLTGLTFLQSQRT